MTLRRASGSPPGSSVAASAPPASSVAASAPAGVAGRRLGPAGVAGRRLGPAGVAGRRLGPAGVVDRHHPAPREPPVGLEADGARGLEDLEGAVPERQPQDVALPAQQVVLDPETHHRPEVAAHDAAGHGAGHRRRGVGVVLEVVQGVPAVRQPCVVLLVPLRHPRVEVPAVVVEPGLRDEPAHVADVLALELPQPDHHVGHLHAGVVDVVLDLDVGPAEPQQPAQGVAEGGVAEVADVGRLVRVDGGVLDDGLLALPGGGRRRGPADTGARETGSIEEQVEVAGAGRLETAEVLPAGRRLGDLRRDEAGRLPEDAGEVERDGDGEVAHLPVGRILDHDRGRRVGREAVQLAEGRRDGAAQVRVQWQYHARFSRDATVGSGGRLRGPPRSGAAGPATRVGGRAAPGVRGRSEDGVPSVHSGPARGARAPGAGQRTALHRFTRDRPWAPALPGAVRGRCSIGSLGTGQGTRARGAGQRTGFHRFTSRSVLHRFTRDRPGGTRAPGAGQRTGFHRFTRDRPGGPRSRDRLEDGAPSVHSGPARGARVPARRAGRRTRRRGRGRPACSR